ncbi:MULTISPECIES: hypothetical protein [Cetobacterium]|uniref:hypothetical protein n=1 Tax=Cetobacterium TaxID=180162 RepID=UPI00163C318E|nr:MULTISPECIES: hypothetical protein [Cetobacterium]MBC2852473.1 hypothetical protein [Cetobacterium sp. 2G large]WVJ02843.1 hypothetical protein VSU16_14210 [Cetobacterium somerae]
MKLLNRFLILGSLILTLASCSNSNLESTPKAVEINKNQNYSPSMAIKNSETIRNVGVENAILEAYNLQRGIDPVYYSYVKIDLNSDSVPEYFVYAYGPMLSGSGGGSALILNSDYKEISRFTLVQTPIIINNHRTKNWKDIIMTVSGGGATPATAIMKFDGKTYPLNPSLQPTLGTHDYIDGVKIFTENISKNQGFKIE